MGALSVFIVVVLASLCIWMFFEIISFKGKFFMAVLLFLLIFFLISSGFVLRGKNIDLTKPKGVVEAGKVYASFVTVAVKNVATLTANAINMDWSVSDSPKNSSKK